MKIEFRKILGDRKLENYVFEKYLLIGKFLLYNKVGKVYFKVINKV